MLPSLGLQEIILLGILALVVVGPRDLPLMMRKIGQWMARLRGMAQEFRTGFDELARQAELDELRREVDALRQSASDIRQEFTRPLGAAPFGAPEIADGSKGAMAQANVQKTALGESAPIASAASDPGAQDAAQAAAQAAKQVPSTPVGGQEIRYKKPAILPGSIAPAAPARLPPEEKWTEEAQAEEAPAAAPAPARGVSP